MYFIKLPITDNTIKNRKSKRHYIPVRLNGTLKETGRYQALKA
jgi:hypothetical protein